MLSIEAGRSVGVSVCELACINEKKRGFFLSISMHLLQIVTIYLFIFPQEKVFWGFLRARVSFLC